MTLPVHASDTFDLAGRLTVHRLGFGAMRITGKGIWGEPPDLDVAREVVREAVRLGVDFIDTADSYGPEVSERLIAEALHPYPEGLVIATKAGYVRHGPGQWEVDCRPERLRACCEASLRRLRVDCIDLWQLHRIDEQVPLAEQLGVMRELQQEGKIRLAGLSEVTVEQLDEARRSLEIATVQNRYNYADRDAEPLLEACEAAGIGFIPWYPLATGDLSGNDSPLAETARRRGATPGQLALAWLLSRSPVMLPIPGTGSLDHLRENCEAALVEVSGEELAALS